MKKEKNPFAGRKLICSILRGKGPFDVQWDQCSARSGWTYPTFPLEDRMHFLWTSYRVACFRFHGFIFPHSELKITEARDAQILIPRLNDLFDLWRILLFDHPCLFRFSLGLLLSMILLVFSQKTLELLGKIHKVLGDTSFWEVTPC
jgi:hypothetical protein